MKRNDDLLRELLFRLEGEDDHMSAAFVQSMGMSKVERQELGHILLLVDAGFVSQSGKSGDIYRITNSGHDFIAAVRDDTLWNQTKDIAKKGGAQTVDVLFRVAIGLGKQKIKELTGLDV